jgi:Domain of Unknown Function (DUF928)
MFKLVFAVSSISWIVLSLYAPFSKAAELNTANRYQWNDQSQLNLKNRIVLAQSDFPKDRRKTGSSGPCSAEQNIIPVVPITPVSTDFIYRRSDTTKSHPSFWFYIPHSSVVSAEFTLTEWKKTESIYASSISISQTPGIIRIQIPEEAKSLQEEKWYEAKLSLRVRCRPGAPVKTEFKRSWIRRRPLNSALDRQINQAQSALQKAVVYADAGFWYDALKVLDTNGTSSSSNEWSTLLKKYGLEEEVVAAKRVNCCNPTTQTNQ